MLPQIYQLKEFKEGYLAIMGRPRGWDWLEDEIVGLRQLGIGLVVSLLEADEESELGLIKEREICEKQGIQFISFPIKDRGVPSSLEDTAQLTDYLRKQLATGKKVVIHCRAGIGRSALVAACYFCSS